MSTGVAAPGVPSVVLLAPLPQAAVDALEAAGHRVVREVAQWSAAQVAVTRGSLPTDDDTLARLPNLRLLCCWGSGHDGVDLQAAARRGITVCHCPGGNAASVADLAIGFVIALMRQLPVAERHLRAGRWQDMTARLPAARGLTGARLGLFGHGEVGRRVARRALALEMAVGCFTRRAPETSDVAVFGDLLSLARWADVLVVAVRADAVTHHAVDAAVLDALGPHGCLVNVARGNIVDEVALRAALREGRLAGYGSDVFEHEPQVPPEILAFPNAILSPHVGGATHGAEQTMVRTLLSNIAAFVGTGEPVHRVIRP